MPHTYTPAYPTIRAAGPEPASTRTPEMVLAEIKEDLAFVLEVNDERGRLLELSQELLDAVLSGSRYSISRALKKAERSGYV